MIKKTAIILICVLMFSCFSGCVLTRLVTMPMRVVGGAVTIVPVAGDAAHKTIDESADLVDEIPI